MTKTAQTFGRNRLLMLSLSIFRIINYCSMPTSMKVHCCCQKKFVLVTVVTNHHITCFTGISREEIVGNSMFMVLAGYETTAGALQFLAYNLAVHPECQESLRKEIKDAVEEYVRIFVLLSFLSWARKQLAFFQSSGVVLVIDICMLVIRIENFLHYVIPYDVTEPVCMEVLQQTLTLEPSCVK